MWVKAIIFLFYCLLSLDSANGHSFVPDYANRDYYAIVLEPGSSPEHIEHALGIRYEGKLGELVDHYVFSTTKNIQTGSLQGNLVKRKLSSQNFLDSLSAADRTHVKRIKESHRQIPSRRLHKRYIPPSNPLLHKKQQVEGDNDESQESNLFLEFEDLKTTLDIADPMFNAQWHLFNTEIFEHDLRVGGIWKQNITGRGVITSIIDDGLDMNSRDLADNYFANASYDFNDHRKEPFPSLSDDYHGTRCAGEIAAVKNDVCGIGVAYDSKVSAVRILSGEITTIDEAAALNYGYQEVDIYSCSWGPSDDGKSMDGPVTIVQRAIINGIRDGRDGKGSIFVFASGNGGGNDDNCNFDGYTNSIFTITIGAIDIEDKHPYYSEHCAAQLAVTYSSGHNQYIHTTDVGQDRCTARHGGTSAAAPLAAGIFALALSVRNDLTWRDLQYLCFETAVPFDLEDEDWAEVGSGKLFNHKYGFGKLDAYAFVEKAKDWTLRKPQVWYHRGKEEINLPLVEDYEITSTVMIQPEHLEEANFENLEHVTVTVNINHQCRGDLVIALVSPSGTISELASARKHDDSRDGFKDWTFSTVKHWGEIPYGEWTLIVADVANPEKTGVWKDWSLSLWGEASNGSLAYPVPFPDDESDSIEEPPPVSNETISTTMSSTTSSVTEITETLTYQVSSVETYGSTTSANEFTTSNPSQTSAVTSNSPSSLPSNEAEEIPSELPYFTDKTSSWIFWALGGIVIFIVSLIVYVLFKRYRLLTKILTGSLFSRSGRSSMKRRGVSERDAYEFDVIPFDEESADRRYSQDGSEDLNENDYSHPSVNLSQNTGHEVGANVDEFLQDDEDD